MYKVMALYSDHPQPFAEHVGTFTNETDAKDAADQFRDREDANHVPNFMSCFIEYLGPVRDADFDEYDEADIEPDHWNIDK